MFWRGVFGCTMRVKYRGIDRIAPDGGLLVAVSHLGHLDPIVISSLTRRRISWMSRIEFHRKWLMRTILHHGGSFKVDRQGPALPAIREALQRLGRGEAVGIFPEGEVMRGPESVLNGAAVKRGVCLLAARSGCPVVPVVILGTERLAQVGPWLPAKRGKLWILVGEPMFAHPWEHTRRGRAEFAARLEKRYVELYQEMRETFGHACLGELS